MIYAGLKVCTCGYNYGGRMQNTYLVKNDIMFVSRAILSGIILGLHVDQLVLGTP